MGLFDFLKPKKQDMGDIKQEKSNTPINPILPADRKMDLKPEEKSNMPGRPVSGEDKRGDLKPEEKGNTPVNPVSPADRKGDLKPEEIYIPDEPRRHKEEVQHMEISFEQAREQGWHYNRKSRKRMRITRYTGTEKNITVPARIGDYIVNEIGQRAFYGADIDSVLVPDTVKKLNSLCFCTSTVKKVTFAEGIPEIPDDAFRSCQNLSRVHLPATVCRIGKRAFYSCKSLPYINIPSYCRVEEEAFRYSGLKGLACGRVNDGNAFANTPLQMNYKLVLVPPNYYNSDIDYDVLLVGTKAEVKFPGGSVHLGKNSIVHGCNLDLSKCSRIRMDIEAFWCKRDRWGVAGVMPACKVIVPQGAKGIYLPRFVDAFYPNGIKYAGYITAKSDHADKTTLYVNGEELPSFSITHISHKGKRVDIEAEKSLRFYEYAVSSPAMESISFSDIYGEGELFFAGCRRLHKVEWNGKYCAYIPSEELVGHQAHIQLLKAFSGIHSGGFYRFFDSGVIGQVFTKPVSSYAEFRLQPEKPVRLSQKSKILIAVDVLRSTETLFENRELYVKYLQTHKRYAKAVCEKLPEKWQEYKNFLKAFYEEAAIWA